MQAHAQADAGQQRRRVGIDRLPRDVLIPGVVGRENLSAVQAGAGAQLGLAAGRAARLCRGHPRQQAAGRNCPSQEFPTCQSMLHGHDEP